jgi:hypothetical protein
MVWWFRYWVHLMMIKTHGGMEVCSGCQHHCSNIAEKYMQGLAFNHEEFRKFGLKYCMGISIIPS